jgi:hypothetical protein
MIRERSAVKLALNLTIDLNEALGSNALPSIFNPLAITVPRCLDANIVTSFASRRSI